MLSFNCSSMGAHLEAFARARSGGGSYTRAVAGWLVSSRQRGENWGWNTWWRNLNWSKHMQVGWALNQISWEWIITSLIFPSDTPSSYISSGLTISRLKLSYLFNWTYLVSNYQGSIEIQQIIIMGASCLEWQRLYSSRHTSELLSRRGSLRGHELETRPHAHVIIANSCHDVFSILISIPISLFVTCIESRVQ